MVEVQALGCLLLFVMSSLTTSTLALQPNTQTAARRRHKVSSSSSSGVLVQQQRRRGKQTTTREGRALHKVRGKGKGGNGGYGYGGYGDDGYGDGGHQQQRNDWWPARDRYGNNEHTHGSGDDVGDTDKDSGSNQQFHDNDTENNHSGGAPPPQGNSNNSASSNNNGGGSTGASSGGATNSGGSSGSSSNTVFHDNEIGRPRPSDNGASGGGGDASSNNSGVNIPGRTNEPPESSSSSTGNAGGGSAGSSNNPFGRPEVGTDGGTGSNSGSSTGGSAAGSNNGDSSSTANLQEQQVNGESGGTISLNPCAAAQRGTVVETSSNVFIPYMYQLVTKDDPIKSVRVVELAVQDYLIEQLILSRCSGGRRHLNARINGDDLASIVGIGTDLTTLVGTGCANNEGDGDATCYMMEGLVSIFFDEQAVVQDYSSLHRYISFLIAQAGSQVSLEEGSFVVFEQVHAPPVHTDNNANVENNNNPTGGGAGTNSQDPGTGDKADGVNDNPSLEPDPSFVADGIVDNEPVGGQETISGKKVSAAGIFFVSLFAVGVVLGSGFVVAKKRDIRHFPSGFYCENGSSTDGSNNDPLHDKMAEVLPVATYDSESIGGFHSGGGDFTGPMGADTILTDLQQQSQQRVSPPDFSGTAHRTPATRTSEVVSPRVVFSATPAYPSSVLSERTYPSPDTVDL